MRSGPAPKRGRVAGAEAPAPEIIPAGIGQRIAGRNSVMASVSSGVIAPLIANSCEAGSPAQGLSILSAGVKEGITGYGRGGLVA